MPAFSQAWTASPSFSVDSLLAGAFGRAVRSANDPVVCFDHGVGQERLPLDSAHREDRDAAVLREFAQPVGEVALPLPPQPCDPMRGNSFEETVRNSQPPHVV